MVRTFWIGAASLVTICSLATAKFVARAPTVVSASMQNATDYSRPLIGLATQQDTLSKADKLPVGSDNEQGRVRPCRYSRSSNGRLPPPPET